ncbi:uroporphyrinogen decarboxylase [Alkalihalobacillus xiaoxiensis]|uniref:Uroporphyrinogen decarboxylase n=1 Tax=Shouchella xiaoxiensis TaxID=766895 RepID=A0ABS2ST39_9BACI|nr:uroporphyrinogen decarboxylase [Shouchella xiaoxiensis]MBM7837975.1 uroporphyrinogen decarboxylase [Shouchella xiaoxiensis]
MSTDLFNDTFLKACRGEAHDHVPVWYMRQAGRTQPEYLKIKETHSLFDITHDPELCAYVTKLPVDQYNNDAAILYKDIMTPLPFIGVDVEIKSGVGPVIYNPIETEKDVEALGVLNPEKDVAHVLETIKLLRTQLNVPLISFGGAPFTLASYMIEGGPSRNYHKTKAFMHSKPAAWHRLMEKLGDMTIAYISAQIKAGSQAIQLFDSWVGTLSVADYNQFIKPVMVRILEEVKTDGVPLILHGVGTPHLMKEWKEMPADVIGLDWRTSIADAREIGITKTVQGNLDPSILLAPWDVIERETRNILDEGMKSNHFIFNLGQGVFPEVKPATLKRLTAFIHEYSADYKRTQKG